MAGAVRDLLIIVVCFVVGFVLRAGTLPIEGEESRRGQFAVEMLRSGDFVSMTQQGVLFTDRPPGQYWVLAASFAAAGGAEPGVNAGVTVWSLRIPTLLFTLGTAFLCWWAARRVAGGLAGLAAGLAYLTMLLTLDIGRRAETESQFTFLMAAAVLAWHALYEGRRRLWAAWVVGYALAAAAALTKGTQAPVTFCGAAGLYLLVRRDWRAIFSPAHVAGIVVFVALVGLWQWPFYQRYGWEESARAWFLEAGNRLSAPLGERLEHYATFPLEALAVMLPWSVLLAALVHRAFWRGGAGAPARGASALAVFCVIVIGVVAIPVWLVPHARVRYAMPMLPMGAVIAGLVVARAGRVLPDEWPAVLVRGLSRAGAVGLAGMGAFFLVVSVAARPEGPAWMNQLAQPPWWAVVQAVVMCAGAAVLFSAGAENDAAHLRRGVVTAALLVALFAGTTFSNFLLKRTRDMAPAVAEVRAMLPAGERLVSLGLTAHRFVYFWPEPIEPLLMSKPQAATARGLSARYFVFTSFDSKPMPEPLFPWRKIADVPLDRTFRARPQWVVTVGERLEQQPAAAP